MDVNKGNMSVSPVGLETMKLTGSVYKLDESM